MGHEVLHFSQENLLIQFTHSISSRWTPPMSAGIEPNHHPAPQHRQDLASCLRDRNELHEQVEQATTKFRDRYPMPRPTPPRGGRGRRAVLTAPAQHSKSEELWEKKGCNVKFGKNKIQQKNREITA